MKMLASLYVRAVSRQRDRLSPVFSQRLVAVLSIVGIGMLIASGCSEQPATSEAGGEAETVIIRPESSGADSAVSGSASANAPTSEEPPAASATQGREPSPEAMPGHSGGELVLAGKFRVTLPDGWQPKQPAINMIEYEFTVPAAEGDPRDGRVTFMAAGGTVEANIDRWLAQFAQPDGSDTRDRAKIEKIQVSGLDVHLVDVAGTFNESSGPMMGNPIPRQNYRMLGAIIANPDGGMPYFIKFYGPEKTVAANADAFRKMIESLH